MKNKELSSLKVNLLYEKIKPPITCRLLINLIHLFEKDLDSDVRMRIKELLINYSGRDAIKLIALSCGFYF